MSETPAAPGAAGAEPFRYVGTELDLFAAARNWKEYVRRQVEPYLRGRVLEVGAGMGTTTSALCRGGGSWVLLEPDPELVARIDLAQLPPGCEARVGTLADLPADERFDAVLYMDVLEHIEDDRGELARAAARLAPGGHLVVLAPAHGWLFTPFDTRIGHFRRYTWPMLRRIAPPGLVVVRRRYLDAVGLFASLANRLLLRQSMPTAEQLRVWDRLMVPLSRLVDPLLAHRAGKSVLAVWRSAPSASASVSEVAGGFR